MCLLLVHKDVWPVSFGVEDFKWLHWTMDSSVPRWRVCSRRVTVARAHNASASGCSNIRLVKKDYVACCAQS